MALSISHRPPPPTKPLDASLRGYLASNADIVTRITKPVHMDDIGALSAQSDAADPVREHRREARLPAVRHPGEDPPLAGARARDDAGELSAHARLPAAPAAARIESRQDRPGQGGGEAAQRGRLDRAADPVPQGQGRGALRHRHEHHPRSRDRLLQFLSRRHPRGRAAPRTDQLRHAAFARHHAQISRPGHGRDADRLRVRRAAGLRDHGQLLRPAHGRLGRDGDGRHHHGPRHRDGAVRDARAERAGASRDRGRGPCQPQGQVQGRRRHLAVDVQPAALREPAGGRDHRDHHARRPADLPQPPDLPRHRPSAVAAALSRGGALQSAERDRPRRQGRALPDLGRGALLHPPVRAIRARAWSTMR